MSGKLIVVNFIMGNLLKSALKIYSKKSRVGKYYMLCRKYLIGCTICVIGCMTGFIQKLNFKTKQGPLHKRDVKKKKPPGSSPFPREFKKSPN